MEIKLPLTRLGEFVRNQRKKLKMNQTEFYRFLFPEKNLEDENIKKKMNAIEHGKGKELNYELLFRLHEKFDLSFDYLFGFETEYPNYDNKAACNYTGLEPEAIRQLHFWSKYIYKEDPEYVQDMTEQQYKDYIREKTRIGEAKWIFAIMNALLKPKSAADIKDGISDLSILYDMYMMMTNDIEHIRGLPLDIVNSDLSWNEKALSSVTLCPDTLYFTDSMNETHKVNIGEVNRKIWEERLLKDINNMIQYLRANA